MNADERFVYDNTRTDIDEVMDEIKENKRLYREKIGFDRWLDELIENNATAYPDMDTAINAAITRLLQRESTEVPSLTARAI